MTAGNVMGREQEEDRPKCLGQIVYLGQKHRQDPQLCETVNHDYPCFSLSHTTMMVKTDI